MDKLEGCWLQRVLQADNQPECCPSVHTVHQCQKLSPRTEYGKQRRMERWLSQQRASYEHLSQELTQQPDMVVYACDPSAESWRQVNPLGLLATSLVQFVSTRLGVSNTKMESKGRRHPILTSGLHVHVKPTPMHTYMNTVYTHHIYMYVYMHAHIQVKSFHFKSLKDRLDFVRQSVHTSASF